MQPTRDQFNQLESLNRQLDFLKKGYKLTKVAKNPYPIKDAKGQVVYQDFADEMADRRQYLQRLRQYLPYLVQQNLLTPKEAQSQFDDAKFALTSVSAKGSKQFFTYDSDEVSQAGLMPFTKELSVPEIKWRQTQQELQKTSQSQERQQLAAQSKIERTTSDYLPFLNAQVASGKITPDEKNAVLGEIATQIKLGVSPNDLPFADTVGDYYKNYQQTLKMIGQQNENNQAQAEATNLHQFNAQNQVYGKAGGYGEYLAKQQTEQQRAQNEIDFENYRKQKIGNLSPYSDWIERWQVEHTPNPFKVNPYEAHQQYVGQLEGRLSGLNSALASGQKTFGYGDAPWIQNPVENFDPNAIQQELERAKSTWDYTPEPQPQMLPNTPDWLTQFTGLKAGQPIAQAPIITPSGQAWSKLLPSQRAMLSSFSDWIGKPIGDLTYDMERMLPRTPHIGYRTGYEFSPIRQGG